MVDTKKGIKKETICNYSYIFVKTDNEYVESLNSKEILKYDTDGNLEELLLYTGSSSSKFVNKYDTMGNKIEQLNYDLNGNVIEESNYDLNGNLTDSQYGVCKTIFKYDTSGNKVDD